MNVIKVVGWLANVIVVDGIEKLIINLAVLKSTCLVWLLGQMGKWTSPFHFFEQLF